MVGVKEANGRLYANCPPGANYISSNGIFIMSSTTGGKTQWYQWNTYHGSWKITDTMGFQVYPLTDTK